MVLKESRVSNSRCYLCKKAHIRTFNGSVRDKPELRILQCRECGLIFLDSFDHIKSRFYENSRMHQDPLGEKSDYEHEKDENRRFEYCRPLINGKALLDIGCAHGGFLLKCRPFCQHIAGIDPDLSFQPIYSRHDLIVYHEIEAVPSTETYDLITIFHVLEHLPDPIDTLTSLIHLLNPGGKILIEVPNSDDALIKLYKNKGFLNFFWSCHLYLFNMKNLKIIVERAGFKIEYTRQIQRYTPSNHLFWLSENQPGGHANWHFLDSPDLSEAYENRLASLGMCDTLLSLISPIPG